MKAIDMASGKVTRWQRDAHEAPINCIHPLGSGVVASGDDDGCVKLWDGRQSAAIAEISEHTDFISDFAYQVGVRLGKDAHYCFGSASTHLSSHDRSPVCFYGVMNLH
jgi:WD40 repeat protein